jgi:hypothetical protein
MKQQLLENLKKDTSGKWVSIDDVAALVDQMVNEAVSAVEKTGTQCAFTTHDLGTVQCTIDRSVDAVKKHFGLA